MPVKNWLPTGVVQRIKAYSFYILLGLFSFAPGFRSQAQTITTGAAPMIINTGANFMLPVAVTGSYLVITSVFSAYLSDASGSFAIKTLIGS
ncbi:MAG: hypothetical protein ABI729_03370, partial [Chitinophagales bacterium]